MRRSVRASALLSMIACLAGATAAACETTGGLTNGEDIPAPRRDSGSDPPPGDGGGPQDTGGPIDTSPRCDPIQAYGAPQLQTELDGTKTAKGAVMTADGLEIFYLRSSGGWELRHGRRMSRNEPWEVVTDALSPTASAGLSLSVGGLKLYYWNFEAPTNGRNLYGTRTAKSQPFANPQNVTGYGRVMHVSASDDSAYFAEFVTMDGGAVDELIMRGNVINNGVNLFKPLENLHTAGALDSKPVLNASETIIYFSSNRPNGAGADDIYVSKRPSKQSTFAAPSHPAELNSAQPESVTWVADDDCEILIDRASHIYRATRPPLQ